MDVSRQSPGSFDLREEITKLVLSPDWQEVWRDQSKPLLVFTNQKTGQMKVFGDDEACRIALDGWNTALNQELRKSKGFGHLNPKRTRRN